ncbi:MAG: Hsp20/alpha crystallin family protein [Treponema sp.]|nr:Hsp20/alpha crystallin family protein [Treponema sp.]
MKTLTLYRPAVVEDTGITGMPWSEFNRSIDSFFGNGFLSPAERIFNRLPNVDVRETDKVYIIEAELPGYDEKEISIHLENNTLTIESKKEEAKEEKKDAAYLIRERRTSSFNRAFKLPVDADSEGIKASFRNGILSLEIGKKPEAARKQIQISSN